MLASFTICLLAFLLIGILSVTKNKHTTSDYLLTSYNTAPSVVALSGVATNNSGYMFIGMIGYTVSVGLASIWLMIGWILGDFLVSLFVHKKLRKTSEQYQLVSYSSVLSQIVGAKGVWLSALGGIITLTFLSTYAAAQLAAGGKALNVIFGLDFATGSIIGAGIVVIYCFIGGIRASFWTDVAQSIVMILAMLGLVVAGITSLGGWTGFIDGLRQLEPSYLYWFPISLTSPTSSVLFVIGWLAAGTGVVGQPHIMLRFLALDNPDHMTRVRVYYYSWYTLFYVMTILVGMIARLLLPIEILQDPELALPQLSIQLLHPVYAGLVIAGLFAATMSTADSQIMTCAASITHDFSLKRHVPYWLVKGTTLAIAMAALAVAVAGNQSVFQLVLLSWSGMGSAFAPLAMVSALGYPPTVRIACTMILTGLTGSVLGKVFLPNIYEILPGMAASFLVYIIGLALQLRRSYKQVSK